MSRADLQTYLVELLMKQDQMSMAASIESRVPFLDHALVEHVAAMPGRSSCAGWRTKAVLRDGARATWCRREILTRRKMGFPVPVGPLAARARSGRVVEELVLGAARAARAGSSTPAALRRLADGASRGAAAPRRPALAAREPRDLAAHLHRRRASPRPVAA